MKGMLNAELLNLFEISVFSLAKMWWRGSLGK